MKHVLVFSSTSKNDWGFYLKTKFYFLVLISESTISSIKRFLKTLNECTEDIESLFDKVYWVYVV